MCFTDVLATLAAVVDRPLPADAGPDSFSFLPVLLGRQNDRDPVRPHLLVGQSLRVGPRKWIEGRERLEWANPDSGTYTAKNEPPGQLYNLADDPGEKKNLAAALPGKVAELKAAHARIQSGAQARR